jgi:F-type H+-transporting ATPase subunit epsilon
MPMHLKILIPHQVFAEKSGVVRIVAETREGSYGLLPRRLDCVMALTPGILLYQSEGSPESYVAVDEGVLVKSGAEVLVSVRRALAGSDLRVLQAAVEREFLRLDDQERSLRMVLAKLEAGFLRGFAGVELR